MLFPQKESLINYSSGPKTMKINPNGDYGDAHYFKDVGLLHMAAEGCLNMLHTNLNKEQALRQSQYFLNDDVHDLKSALLHVADLYKQVGFELPGSEHAGFLRDKIGEEMFVDKWADFMKNRGREYVLEKLDLNGSNIADRFEDVFFEIVFDFNHLVGCYNEIQGVRGDYEFPDILAPVLKRVGGAIDHAAQHIVEFANHGDVIKDRLDKELNHGMYETIADRLQKFQEKEVGNNSHPMFEV